MNPIGIKINWRVFLSNFGASINYLHEKLVIKNVNYIMKHTFQIINKINFQVCRTDSDDTGTLYFVKRFSVVILKTRKTFIKISISFLVF